MRFQWSDNLTLATTLYRQGRASADEAQLRCAIGRAYYAAFGTAGDYLRAQGEVATRGATHHNVWSTFQRYHSGTIEFSVGALLQDMLVTRKWADYQNPYPGGSLEDDADDVIGNAELVLAYLQQLRGSER